MFFSFNSGVGKKLIVVLLKLSLHIEEICEGEDLQLTGDQGLHGEFPRQVSLVYLGTVRVSSLLMRELDVGETKVVPFLYFDVHNVVVLWNYIPSETALKEVNLVYLILLLVYVVHLVAFNHFKKRTDPADKPAILALEKCYVKWKVFVNLPRQVIPQQVWQLVDKFRKVLLILAVVILYGLHQVIVEVLGDPIVLLYAVQDVSFLLKLRLGRVVARNNRREGACGEGERYDSDQH